jgi:hypothetical protein
MVMREAWAAETEGFKEEVLAVREAEHQCAMDAYAIAVSAEVPSNAEEYNV